MEISGLKTIKGLGTAIVVLAIIGIVISAGCIIASDFVAEAMVQQSLSDYEGALASVGLTMQDIESLPSVQDQIEANKLYIIATCVWNIVFSVLLLVAGTKARKVVASPAFETIKSARNWGIAAIVFSVLGASIVCFILSIIIVVKANGAKKQVEAAGASAPAMQ